MRVLVGSLVTGLALACSYDWELAAPEDGGTNAGGGNGGQTGGAGGSDAGGSGGTSCDPAACLGVACKSSVPCGNSQEIECCTGTNACAADPTSSTPDEGVCVELSCLTANDPPKVMCGSKHAGCPASLCESINAKCCDSSGLCVEASDPCL